jgi:acyl-homoserine lactone acylase PvdQ
LAPAKTASGNAILYINPHTTFYFRPEMMSSRRRLNAYGAVTWGQFLYIKDLMKIVDGCILY